MSSESSGRRETGSQDHPRRPGCHAGAGRNEHYMPPPLLRCLHLPAAVVMLRRRQVINVNEKLEDVQAKWLHAVVQWMKYNKPAQHRSQTVDLCTPVNGEQRQKSG